MQPYRVPEIDNSELDAARRFLTSLRDEERRARVLRLPQEVKDGVTVCNGIARARRRSAPKAGA
jgi:hypothetical protein